MKLLLMSALTNIFISTYINTLSFSVVKMVASHVDIIL
jgi:hypothetical protein